jgi:uracil-DNA glycosylase
MSVKLKNDWNEKLSAEFEKDYYRKLRSILKKEYETYKIYPPMDDIFNALHYTSLRMPKCSFSVKILTMARTKHTDCVFQ